MNTHQPKNTVDMSRSRLLHLCAEPSFDRRVALVDYITPLRSYETDYLEYINDGYTKGIRDYDKLRRVLGKIQIVFAKQLLQSLNHLWLNIGQSNEEILYVYDLGSGSSIWPDLLQLRFPNACVMGVDRDAYESMTSQKKEWIIGDIPTLLDLSQETYPIENRPFITGPQTVFFMSEFLHCKRTHFELLRLPILQQSYLIINEVLLEREPSIHRRLMETQGGLLKPSSIQQTAYPDSLWVVEYYQALFAYYLIGRPPAKS